MIYYIEELGREFTELDWETWHDRGPLAPSLRKYYQDLWRAEAAARRNPDAPAPVVQLAISTAKPLLVLRPNRCEHLEQRTEFKAGCNGWRCLHGCSKGLPAVPGILCQECDQYEDSGEKF